MRRAGQNPTDIEVHDMINKIDNGSGVLDFEDFLLVMGEKNRETDIEIHFKDTFRAFSKDKDGKSRKCCKGYRRFIKRFIINCCFKMDEQLIILLI